MKNKEFAEYIYEDFDHSQDPIDLEDYRKQVIKETEKKILDRSRNYRGRSDTVYMKITTGCLSDLFQVNKRTILRWIKKKRFDPSNIRSIIEYYNQL